LLAKPKPLVAQATNGTAEVINKDGDIASRPDAKLTEDAVVPIGNGSVEPLTRTNEHEIAHPGEKARRACDAQVGSILELPFGQLER
jgi:hypothetical protein